MTNGFTHHYHMGTHFHFRDVRCVFRFLFHIFIQTNRLAPDGAPRSAASHLGLNSLRPRGRVVKVADFSALDHSIISPMWVRASHGARIHM